MRYTVLIWDRKTLFVKSAVLLTKLHATLSHSGLSNSAEESVTPEPHEYLNLDLDLDSILEVEFLWGFGERSKGRSVGICGLCRFMLPSEKFRRG